MAKVSIGVDPHKLSATIEVVDGHETVLATGRFGTDKAGYAAMRKHFASYPERVWAVDGSNGTGRPLARSSPRRRRTPCRSSRTSSGTARATTSSRSGRCTPHRPDALQPRCEVVPVRSLPAGRAGLRPGPGLSVKIPELERQADSVGIRRHQPSHRRPITSHALTPARHPARRQDGWLAALYAPWRYAPRL